MTARAANAGRPEVVVRAPAQAYGPPLAWRVLDVGPSTHTYERATWHRPPYGWVERHGGTGVGWRRDRGAAGGAFGPPRVVGGCEHVPTRRPLAGAPPSGAVPSGAVPSGARPCVTRPARRRRPGDAAPATPPRRPRPVDPRPPTDGRVPRRSPSPPVLSARTRPPLPAQPPQPRPRPEFVGAGFAMNANDWRRAAVRLACEPAAIRAVAEQEAAGRRGFLPDKRPLILFEAHRFGRFTDYRFDRSHPTLSTRAWDRTLYRGGAAEYERLYAAIALDRRAALGATSWGMFQLMGFNHRAVGHADVESYVAAMCESEGKQLDAFVAFVLGTARLHDALRRRDWATFATLYNGDGYKANPYDTRMARHYRRFLTDTTYLVGVPQRPPAP